MTHKFSADGVPSTDPVRDVMASFPEASFQKHATPEHFRASVRRYLDRSYSLSKSENEIFERLVLGDRLEKIANDRQRSYCTVRAQFYGALKKCNLSSQVDLVRQVITGAAFLMHTHDAKSVLAQDPVHS